MKRTDIWLAGVCGAAEFSFDPSEEMKSMLAEKLGFTSSKRLRVKPFYPS